MILANGQIRILQATGGGMNEKGNPIPAATVFTDPLLCNIKPKNSDDQGMFQGNTFSKSSYEVTVEGQISNPSLVELTYNGLCLGKYQVLSHEYFELVDNTLIVV